MPQEFLLEGSWIDINPDPAQFMLHDLTPSESRKPHELQQLDLLSEPLLDARGASLYCGLIGSTNWAITLGHFDIQYAT